MICRIEGGEAFCFVRIREERVLVRLREERVLVRLREERVFILSDRGRGGFLFCQNKGGEGFSQIEGGEGFCKNEGEDGFCIARIREERGARRKPPGENCRYNPLNIPKFSCFFSYQISAKNSFNTVNVLKFLSLAVNALYNNNIILFCQLFRKSQMSM